MKQSPAPETETVGLTLFSPKQYARLLGNGKRAADRLAAGQGKIDFHPVAKLINPLTNAVWLVTEIDPAKPNIATGLIDLGVNTPSIGEFDLRELVRADDDGELAVHADKDFRSVGRISSYAQTARAMGRVIA